MNEPPMGSNEGPPQAAGPGGTISPTANRRPAHPEQLRGRIFNAQLRSALGMRSSEEETIGLTDQGIMGEVGEVRWMESPKRVLVVRKPGDEEVDLVFVKVVRLCKHSGLEVFLEDAVFDAVLRAKQAWQELGQPRCQEATTGVPPESQAASSIHFSGDGTRLTPLCHPHRPDRERTGPEDPNTPQSENFTPASLEHVASIVDLVKSWDTRASGGTSPMRAEGEGGESLAPPIGSNGKRREAIDLVVSLGGDGCVMHASGLFPDRVPPVLAFAFGSLGFLTNLSSNDMESVLTIFLREGCEVSMRHRVYAYIVDEETGAFVREVGVGMNEIVVERGPSAQLIQLEVMVDGHYLTTVHGDGVIVATPTGSTAYNLSAGGSIAHPAVPCLILTPISPHSLSFRPAIFPESSCFRLSVPPNARSTAQVCVDGRTHFDLKRNETLVIVRSKHPVPMVCQSEATSDWINALHCRLNWNLRFRQKGKLMGHL